MTADSAERRLRALVLLCHAGLTAAAAGAALTLPASVVVRALVLAVALGALGLTARALAARRPTSRTYAALVLVLCIGAATAEVVASADRASFATLVLVLGLVELGGLVLLARVSSRG